MTLTPDELRKLYAEYDGLSVWSGRGSYERWKTLRAQLCEAVPSLLDELAETQMERSDAEIQLDEAGHCWNLVLATGAHRPLIDAWGLRAVTILTWTKPGGNGLGRYLRGATEHAVLAVKGWGTVPATPEPSSWFPSARAPHSVKPGAAYDIIERVSPGPYVELFARQQRFGWSSWGLGHEIGATA